MESELSPILVALYSRDQQALEAALAATGALNLFEAAALGNVARVAEHLAGQVDLSALTSDGFSALHLGAFFGRTEAVRLLLKAGADPNAVAGHPSHVRALHSAVAGRSYEVTDLLLNYGADVNATQKGGWTALHAVVKHRNEPLVRLLMDHGADPVQVSDDGHSSAAMSEGWDDPEIRRLLFGRADTMDLEGIVPDD